MTLEVATHERVEHLRLTNGRSSECLLHVEPWGEVYTVPPGETFEIEARGPEGESLQVVTSEEGGMTVYGWSGSTLAVFRDGVQVGGSRVPAP